MGASINTLFLRKIYSTIFVFCALFLSVSCGLNKSVEESNENVEETNKSIIQTQEAIQRTQEAILAMEERIASLQESLQLTQDIILEITPSLTDLVKESTNLRSDVNGLDDYMELLHSDIDALVKALNPINKFTKMLNEYANDPKVNELIEIILDENDGMATLLVESNKFLKRLNYCTISVFKYEYANPGTVDSSKTIYGISVKDLEIYKSPFGDEKEYFIIPAELHNTVSTKDRELVPKPSSYCEEIRQELSLQTDRGIKVLIDMLMSTTEQSAEPEGEED